jgi:hypothetical protein
VSDKDPYEVGYARPPAATRFRPGQSGNPSGRPKGRKSFQALVQDAADTKIELKMGGKKVNMSMAQAFIQSLFRSALSGNAKAYPLVVELLQRYLDDEVDATVDENARAAERALVAQLLERHSGSENDSAAT